MGPSSSLTAQEPQRPGWHLQTRLQDQAEDDLWRRAQQAGQTRTRRRSREARLELAFRFSSSTKDRQMKKVPRLFLFPFSPSLSPPLTSGFIPAARCLSSGTDHLSARSQVQMCRPARCSSWKRRWTRSGAAEEPAFGRAESPDWIRCQTEPCASGVSVGGSNPGRMSHDGQNHGQMLRRVSEL